MLTWLQDWYANQCDGDWEHDYGVRIETLDNPGWLVSINLIGTDMEDRQFVRLEREHSAVDWVHCWVNDNIFEGAGGAHNLDAILRIFRDWTDAPGIRTGDEATG
jgi:hypothetical protein